MQFNKNLLTVLFTFFKYSEQINQTYITTVTKFVFNDIILLLTRSLLNSWIQFTRYASWMCALRKQNPKWKRYLLHRGSKHHIQSTKISPTKSKMNIAANKKKIINIVANKKKWQAWKPAPVKPEIWKQHISLRTGSLA